MPESLIAEVQRAKLSADRGSPVLEQLALAEFLEAGELDRHLRKTRVLYRQRRDLLDEALHAHLPEFESIGVAAGLHLLLVLPRRHDEARIVAAAAELGVRVYGAHKYFIGGRDRYPALLLGYGGIREERIEAGVERLARAVKRGSTSRR